jgi:hypothetical protein
MRKRVVSLPIVNSRVIAVTALAALQAVVALAADDCVTKPNLGAPQGGHWYYHVDTVKNRKCWFLRQEDVKGPPAPSSGSSVANRHCSAVKISLLALIAGFGFCPGFGVRPRAGSD